MKLNAIGKKVILAAKKVEKVTESGLILQISQENEFQQGVVVSAGPECEYVKAGDHVTFNKPSSGKYSSIKLSDGSINIMLEETEITAIIG